jgi:L-2,4-diaminobutyrate decarboxylase
MLQNTRQFFSLKRNATVAQMNNLDQFIFNKKNISRYELDIKKGLELVTEVISNKDQPFTGISPKELAKKFKKVDLNTPLKNTDEALSELSELYLKDAVYFHHPKYVAHLNCPVVYPSLLAELIISSINTSVDTWDQSAGGTLVEQKIVDWSIDQIGLGKDADGIFTSGGTQSNLMALLLARDHYCEKILNGYQVKEKGIPACAHKFKIYTSELSHFSVQKSAALLGLGYNSVVAVKHDKHYRMDIDALKLAIKSSIKEGSMPIAIVATTGTTDFGSIDPIHQISDLCQQYDLWMHVDAAYGGGLLVAENQRYKLSGIEKADSVTVDYHKSFFQPVSCGAFFTKNGGNLSYVSHHAEYLNPLSAKQEGTPNLVDKSLQTTRRFDALKLWLTLRIMGAKALGDMFEAVIGRATEVYELFHNESAIEILHKPEISTLVFRFYPFHNSHQPFEINEDFLDRCNSYIRKEIFKSGEAVIAGTKVNGRVYLKFTLLNPETSMKDIKSILTMIKTIGQGFLISEIQAIEKRSNHDLKAV